MKHSPAFAVALLLLAATPAHTGQLTVRDVRLTPLSHPGAAAAPLQPDAGRDSGLRIQADGGSEPDPYLVYPVAGVLGQDLYIPYYVDLDPGPGTLAFNCTHLSYNGNTGEDPYIRSFREEDLGVPVFAAIDGTVIEVHGGEPDHNIDSNPNAVSNYVAILHGANQRTDYLHLRADVLVKAGDVVTAGTQIGWVGSSGQSSGPHIHFESQFNGVPYEPMAGPCRAGSSAFLTQPSVSTRPFAVGAILSRTPFDGLPLPPFDLTTRTGTFVRGTQQIYLRADLANVYSDSQFTITLTGPNGGTSTASGKFTQYQQEFLSAYFGLSVDLQSTGNWVLSLTIDEVTVAVMPFTVVSGTNEILNRPPNPFSATIDPVSAGGVAVCRTNSALIASPDYDVVRYHYQWTVDGSTVRSVTSAAKTDALAQQYATTNAKLTCTIEASDTHSNTVSSQAFAEVSPRKLRRRAAGR